MNPALPGGAAGTEVQLDGDLWSTGGRLGYAFVPYGRLQQGTSPAPNPNQLAIDVHLASAQVHITAPTGTSLDLQLPFGSLITRSVAENRTDTGIGDLELRIRQSLRDLIRRPALVLSAGLVLPTGEYVARSGAANLAPEASYLTLGRGVAWWIVEADARIELTRGVSVFGQLSGRGPVGRTEDDFAWGTELRSTAGVQVAVIGTSLSLVLSSDLQARGGASEPDPFSMERLESSNAGGLQWSLAPAAVFTPASNISLVVGVRIPLLSDVTGNQLVPETGGFIAVSYTQRLTQRRAKASAHVQPALGQLTVVDYWATWCAPCSRISRALEEAAPRWPDVRIIKVDATEWPSETSPALPAGASGLPAIEIFDRSGTRVRLLVGDEALRVVEEVDKLRKDPQ
ncbi:MAG: hypothetical protein H0T42_22400 [Deltaproteobacteria bacterium]|nr:hypothetical protein [Deltaproteobacteria bacterium]